MAKDNSAKSAPFKDDVRTGMGNLKLGAAIPFPRAKWA
jgi:hypothetical protein